MTEPNPLHLRVVEDAEPDNVVRLASYQPARQLPLNDRELMFLRALIANHAELAAMLDAMRGKLDKIATGCPVARRLLQD